MKYLLSSFFLVLILVKGQAQEFPVGSWMVNGDLTLLQQKTGEASTFSAMSIDAKSRVKAHLGGRAYTFHQNGNFELSSSQGKSTTAKGTWKMGAGILKLRFDNGDRADYTVSKVGESWLLQIDGAARQDAVVSNLVLTKKN